MSEAEVDTMGPGEVVPGPRGHTELRAPYTDPPTDGIDRRETIDAAELAQRIVKLGGRVPSGRWNQLDDRIDALLKRPDLKPRDIARLASLQVQRERLIAESAWKLLDHCAESSRDQLEVAELRELLTEIRKNPAAAEEFRRQAMAESGQVTHEVQVVEVEDWYGSAAASKQAAERDETRRPAIATSEELAPDDASSVPQALPENQKAG